jgi:hypothetical protein
MNNSETFLCIDMSNILHKTFYVNAREDSETLAALAYHSSLTTLNKYHKLYKPTKTIFVFDRDNWRKYYTKSEDCYSQKLYKGQRRQNMTPSERKRYEIFLTFISDFETLMREHTGIVCLAGDMLEADDLIAGVAEIYSDQDTVIILSADKDMIQLLKYPNVQLIDPATGKNRTLEEWDNDVDYFMYTKCLRGDIGDNVQSAYPRIRETRIKETYTDPYKRLNMMKETWTDQNKRTMVVGDLFEENQLLMSLTNQPACIRRKIFEVIEYEINNPGKYSHFHFIKFLGKYQLKKVVSQLDLFVPLLMG